MKWHHQTLITLFVISLAGGLIYLADRYHSLYEDEQKRANDAERLAKQRQDIINEMQVRQRDVAALDAKYTKELADETAKNDALRRKLDSGDRMLVKGKCPSVPKTTATATVDHDGTVELSAIAGRNVLDIRAGIKKDQLSLRGLQDYIIRQCLN